MPYIFIHGLGQNSSSWDKTIAFMSKPIDAACPDLSALLENKEANYTNMYCAFSDYCDNITHPLNLCGLSLGGILALNYAIDHPDQVQSLVLIGAQYKMPAALLKLQNIIFRFMPQSAFENIGFKKKDFMQLTNSMMDLDFSQQLKDISAAALVICGEKDSANKKAAMFLAEKIDGAEFQLVAGANHEVNMDNPEKLAELIERFYKRLYPNEFI